VPAQLPRPWTTTSGHGLSDPPPSDAPKGDDDAEGEAATKEEADTKDASETKEAISTRLTSLQLACSTGNEQVVQALLDSGDTDFLYQLL
jgi:hypothetical protein